jgi:hypothetical protein
VTAPPLASTYLCGSISNTSWPLQQPTRRFTNCVVLQRIRIDEHAQMGLVTNGGTPPMMYETLRFLRCNQ